MTNTNEKVIEADDKRWIEAKLRKCRFVEWDRFTVADGPDFDAPVVTVYGWVARPDRYKDFVHVVFYLATRDLDFTTSSDDYSERLFELLTDAEPDEHNPCKRVENHLNVDNAVVLD